MKEGYVVVPKEPTQEMHNRAHQAEPKAGRAARERIYKAMLAAAPSSDQLEQELESLRAFKRSVDEALNSGNGSYRP